MDLDLDDDQQSLRKAAREILVSGCPPSLVRSAWASESGSDRQLWARLASLDLLGLVVPAADGGVGGSDVELAVLLEEAGRVALPGPLIESLVAALTVAEFAETDHQRRWLGRISSGGATATLALGDALVAYAQDADVCLLGRDGELHLAPAERVRASLLPTADHVRRLFSVEVDLDETTLLSADPTAVERLTDRVAVAVAAYLVGIAAQLVELTVDYVKQRFQFGRPVGSFQAVKHRLAQAHLMVETTRPAVWAAAQLVADRADGASAAASAAKAFAAEAAAVANEHALQCHGGIGFTAENDLHLWLKLGKAMERAYGSARFHRGRVAASLFDGRPGVGPGRRAVEPTGRTATPSE